MYFPFEYKQCYSSYVWTGLKEGINILNRDISWKVHSGNLIDVWRDKWIPTLGDKTIMEAIQPHIISQSHTHDHQLLKNFITEHRTWDLQKLQQLIPQQFVPHILNIQLQDVQSDFDSCLWRGKHPTTKGIYNLLLENSEPQFTRPSTANCLPQSLRRKLWKLPVPNKVKNFL